jgi:hypothetical protein
VRARSAIQHHRELAAVGGDRQVLHGLGHEDAGHVHERPERAVLAHDVGDQLLVAVDLRDVADDRRLVIAGLEVEPDDGQAIGAEPSRDRGADAVRRAGDDRDTGVLVTAGRRHDGAMLARRRA